MPSGRGLHVPGGDLLQVAVLAADSQGAAQNRTLREWAGQCRQPDVRPFRVDPLPTSISFEQARELPQSGSGILVGVGGDDLRQVRVDAPGLLVIGQPGSGRSTALAVQALSLADESTPVVLVTPRRSELTATPVHAVRLHLTTTDNDAATKFREALASPGPLTVVVDDAELLADTALGDELTTLYRGIRDTGHRVVAATNMDGTGGFRSWFLSDLAKARCGLVLGPSSPGDAGPIGGARLPLSVLAGGIPLRAVLVHNSVVVPVQVPTVSDFSASGKRPGPPRLVMGVDGGSAAR
jgi:S-DNA-T family DNA segregation ATPase FtsK/SpoIIIE